ncbi:MAG: hypothetical protein Q8O67_24490 [Deltaproteobacteria bacterium]|nr:hypothetical protein [Deltaproteobacteria bacterium]
MRAAVVVVVAVFCGCGPSKVDRLQELSAENPCFDDVDCCVVVEACSADIFVVTTDEFDEAREAAEFDEGGFCNDCLTPTSTVSCVDGRCLAVAFEDPAVTLAEGTPVSSCGVRELVLEEGRDPGATISFQTQFLCGGF